MKEICFDQSRHVDLISMGRVAVDLYAEQIGAPLSEVESFKKYVGGSAGNSAIAAARLGLKVSMLSQVGADAMGDFVRAALIKEGVDVSALQSSEDHLTGLVLLGICPPHHFPLIFYRNECADLYIDAKKVASSFIAQAKALLVTGTGFSQSYSYKNTLAVMREAKEHRTKIILDIDYRPVLWGLSKKGDGETRFKSSIEVSACLQTILPYCDVIVGTEEEICIAGGSVDLKVSIDTIKKFSDAIIVVKKGVEGSAFYADKSETKIAGYPVPVLNVLGAGDAFMGGFLSVLLKNGALSDACRRGNACGAIVVTRHGCAPAMPYLAEVEYFQEHYGAQPIKALEEKLEHHHRNLSITNHRREAPLAIMAFCHRWQLEESCWQAGQSLEKIRVFKTAIAQGVLRAQKQFGIKNVTLLTDPEYGNEVLSLAQAEQISIIAPIERSGGELTEWLSSGSAYEILAKRPPSWGAKILWQYHPKQSEAAQKHQFTKLLELHHAAQKLGRLVMLELLPPKGLSFHSDELLSVIEKVYQASIKPYWWKLPAFSSQEQWQKMASLIDEFDPEARVVTLGGESKDLSLYQQSFSIAKSTHHGIGFAMGRSIFWPAWLKFLRDEFDEDQVSAAVAERYHDFYELWLDA